MIDATDKKDPVANALLEKYDVKGLPTVLFLHPDGTVSGQNVLPGGQSGLTNDAHYADQVPYWLANEALPVHWTVDEVVAAGVERYRFVAQ